METVMAGSCVQVQCTFGDFQRMLQRLQNGCSMPALPICMLFKRIIILKGELQIFQIVYIAPCVKSRRMSQILVFNNASALIEVMQNVSTLQEFTACCLSRLDGRYTMTFDCYLKKEIKMFFNSVLQQFDRKKRQKRCSALRVSCLINMESLWLNTSREEGGRVLFNTNVVF